VDRRALITAAGALLALLAPAAPAHAAGLSFAYAGPPQVSTAGSYTSTITAVASVEGQLMIVVRGVGTTTVTDADDACSVDTDGAHCAVNALPDRPYTFDVSGTYTGMMVALSVGGSDASGPLQYAGETTYLTLPTEVPFPPVPPLPPIPFPPGSFGGFPDHQRDRVLLHTNRARAAHDLPVLAMNGPLTASAQGYADKLAADGAFTHSDGSKLTQRLSAAGYRYGWAGENLGLGQATAGAVVHAWMQSPDHRANMLNHRYTDIGIGVARRHDGQLVWCIDLGQPRTAQAPGRSVS